MIVVLGSSNKYARLPKRLSKTKQAEYECIFVDSVTCCRVWLPRDSFLSFGCDWLSLGGWWRTGGDREAGQERRRERALELLSGVGDANALFRDKARDRIRKRTEIVKVIVGNRGVGQANDTEQTRSQWLREEIRLPLIICASIKIRGRKEKWEREKFMHEAYRAVSSNRVAEDLDNDQKETNTMMLRRHRDCASQA